MPDTIIYDAFAIDPDGDTLTFSVSGLDEEFVITSDNDSGEVRLVSPADYETKNSYTFDVTASDGELYDTKTVTINVTDLYDTFTFADHHILNDNEFVPNAAKDGLNVIQLSLPSEEGYIHYVENFDNNGQYLYDWSIYSTSIDGEYLNHLTESGTSESGFPYIPIEWYSNTTNQWYQESPATFKDATIGSLNGEEVVIELYAGGNTGRNVGSVDILFRDPQNLQKIKQIEISDDIVNDFAFVNYLDGNVFIAYTPLIPEENNNAYYNKSNKIKVIKFDIENETNLKNKLFLKKIGKQTGFQLKILK